jgi:hypothetical protein
VDQLEVVVASRRSGIGDFNGSFLLPLALRAATAVTGRRLFVRAGTPSPFVLHSNSGYRP